MNRLIVDYDSIEIKNYRAQHAVNLQVSSFVSTQSALEKYSWRQIITGRTMPVTLMAISSIAFAQSAAAVWTRRSLNRTSHAAWCARPVPSFFIKIQRWLPVQSLLWTAALFCSSAALSRRWAKWVFPGGYVDRGESVREAAIRETKEECLLDVKLGPLLNVYSYPRSPNVVVVYTAEVIGGTLTAADESTDAAVFAPAELPWHELAFDSTKDAINDYIRDYLK